jgi:hypothetical protein
MPPRSPSRTTWTLALLLLAGAAACDGCPGRKAGAPPGAQAGGGATAGAPGAVAFAPQALLTTIPPGYGLSLASFSADGRHVGFVAAKDGAAYAFLDSTRYGPYDDVRALVLPRDRPGLAFIARREGSDLVVADGVEGARYEAIEGLRLAPDGRAVYAARKDGAWRVVVGAREAVVPGAEPPAPVLSLDGRRVVYADQRPDGGKRSVRSCSLDLADCASGAEFDELGWPHDVLTGRLLACAAARDGQATVVTVDLAAPGLVERTHGWFDAVAHSAVAEGSEHLVFLARRGEGHLLVKDGVELPLPYLESPLDLVASPAGQALLTAILDGKVQLFVDGRPAGKGHEGVYFPTLSPDGSNHAFVAERGPKNALVLKDGEGPLLDRVVTPRFTPDGTKIVYRARRDGQRFVVVADAHGKTLREQPQYDAVFDVAFSPDGGSIGYGVQAGSDLWWKVEKL